MKEETRWPAWLKKRLSPGEEVKRMKEMLSGVDTVCESSLCPNLNECYSRRFATFLILGSHCTRSCGFCSVEKGVPKEIDLKEPARIAEIVDKIGLKYAVITSVTRDDLKDGGASQFAKVVRAIKRSRKDIRIEVLVPDFKADIKAIRKVIKPVPDIFGHNIETIARLYPVARNGADYKRSLGVLSCAKEIAGPILTKSGIMLGLGETKEEVIDLMKDIRSTGCDILTIGQYLRPRQSNMPVVRFLKSGEFDLYRDIGLKLGFKFVSSGPFVRSSYFAEEAYRECVRNPSEARDSICGIMMLASF